MTPHRRRWAYRQRRRLEQRAKWGTRPDLPRWPAPEKPPRQSKAVPIPLAERTPFPTPKPVIPVSEPKFRKTFCQRCNYPIWTDAQNPICYYCSDHPMGRPKA